MHQSIMAFVQRAILPEHIRGKRVLEVGSRNINGSAREYVETLGPEMYLGIDINEGPGVNVVMDISNVNTLGFQYPLDVIITTEMLEHAKDWKAAIMNMKGLLPPGGMIILTTRSVGFGFHNPPDYWRFDKDILRRSFMDFFVDILEDDPQVPGVFMRGFKVQSKVEPIPEDVQAVAVEEI
jgi:SAM-dependent methyltransferase